MKYLFPVCVTWGPMAGRVYDFTRIAIAPMDIVRAHREDCESGPYRGLCDDVALEVAQQLLDKNCTAVKLGIFSRQAAIERAAQLTFAVQDWRAASGRSQSSRWILDGWPR